MNKLEGLPTIHYISLEESVDRRNNLENWFKKYNITNYVPHLFKRYEEGDYEIEGPLVHMLGFGSKGPITSHFILLKKLYENTNKPYFLIVEDDLSLETVDYWNFTWEKFFENFPTDWNCIQLSAIREYYCDQYYFEPRRDKDWSAVAYLIKRDYVKYLLDRYYQNEVFTLDIKEYNCIPVIEQLLFLSPIGGVYSFPLFVEDCKNTQSTFVNEYAFEDGQGSFHYISYLNILNWWKNVGNKLTLQSIMNGKMNHIYQESQFGEDWFSYPNLYSEMIKKFPTGSKFVEVGSWKGKSSAFMAVEIANSYKNIDFYCVDTWEGSVEHKSEYDLETLYDTFISNMKPLENYYSPMKMTSLEAAEKFEDNSLDFVFIDASHEYQDVKNDIIAWLPKVKSGGVLAGHDYYLDYDYFPGVKQAVNECFNENELMFQENCWIYNVKENSNIVNHLIEFSLDTENEYKNYNLAWWYESLGHNAPAHTYYLRAAERADNIDISYQSLIRASFCYKRQGSRDSTEKILLENALMLNSKRPEAYYFLSLFYERKQEWQNCYIYSSLGLDCDKNQFESIDIPEYEGKHLLLVQKAISAWWWGKGQEARELFLELINNHWDELSEHHKKLTEDNISRLGITPYSQSQILYTKDKHNLLRYKFKNSETIDQNYSQVYQDMFVLSMLNGKVSGTFLEIGGAKPFERNNTALLEQKFGWSGVSIELDDKFVTEYKKYRSSIKVIHHDALDIDYRQLLKDNFNSNIIDYLQLDIEPAKNTYECMLRLPFDEYKFAVITYEHDDYVDVTKSYRKKSREYLQSKGYVLVANDLSPEGKSNFEDWWVHPDLIDKNILNIMVDVSDKIKKVEDYMLCNEIKYYAEFETDKYVRETFFPDINYKGTIVEVGAGPPEFLSTSKHFRDSGWKSICVEPNPKFVKQHQEVGSEVYQYACSNEEKKTTFTINYNNDEWYSKENDGVSYSSLGIRYSNVPGHNTQEIIEVDTIKLNTLLKKINVNKIDILSIDTEGWELDVMMGFDHLKYDPKVIILENFENNLNYEKFMNEREYFKVEDLGYNQIYVKKEQKENSSFFETNVNSKSTCWIVDDFYKNPDEIRKFALEQDYLEGGIGRGFIGRRTHSQFLFPGLKEKFEEIIGKKITKWEEHGMNGRFQIAWSGEPLVYHCDSQKWGGMLYLTPNAPYQCGTTLYAHKQTRARTYHDDGWDAAWNHPGGSHLDGTPFEPVDVMGNVYNRLVIFDASCIHSASQYFGTVKENSRLWQMFFFDTDD